MTDTFARPSTERPREAIRCTDERAVSSPAAEPACPVPDTASRAPITTSIDSLPNRLRKLASPLFGGIATAVGSAYHATYPRKRQVDIVGARHVDINTQRHRRRLFAVLNAAEFLLRAEFDLECFRPGMVGITTRARVMDFVGIAWTGCWWAPSGPAFSAPRQHLEVGNGADVDAAIRAKREQVRVPGDKSVHRSGDGYRKNLIIIRIP